MSSIALFYLNYVYLVIVVVADALFLITVVQLLRKTEVDLGLYRRVTLGALFVGLIAFLVGVFVG